MKGVEVTTEYIHYGYNSKTSLRTKGLKKLWKAIIQIF